MPSFACSRKERYFVINPNEKIDKIMEVLVTKGICFIEYSDFQSLYKILPQKMRGLVLFHSEVKSKRIFITYIKNNKK